MARPGERCAHAAHLYVDASSLWRATASYAGAALKRGDAAALIATDANLQGMLAELERRGHDVGELCKSGQLVCLDADERLQQIMRGRTPSRDAFHALALGIIERAKSRFGGLCAYGELVNILWRDDNREAVQTLEGWWDDLIDEHRFPLLCGYQVNVFDEGALADLDAICCTHSHLLAADDGARFDRAIAAAIGEAMPHADVEHMCRELAERDRRTVRLSPAQSAMLALQSLVPALADEVRVRARIHFDRMAS